MPAGRTFCCGGPQQLQLVTIGCGTPGNHHTLHTMALPQPRHRSLRRRPLAAARLSSASSAASHGTHDDYKLTRGPTIVCTGSLCVCCPPPHPFAPGPASQGTTSMQQCKWPMLRSTSLWQRNTTRNRPLGQPLAATPGAPHPARLQNHLANRYGTAGQQGSTQLLLYTTIIRPAHIKLATSPKTSHLFSLPLPLPPLATTPAPDPAPAPRTAPPSPPYALSTYPVKQFVGAKTRAAASCTSAGVSACTTSSSSSRPRQLPAGGWVGGGKWGVGRVGGWAGRWCVGLQVGFCERAARKSARV